MKLSIQKIPMSDSIDPEPKPEEIKDEDEEKHVTDGLDDQLHVEGEHEEDAEEFSNLDPKQNDEEC